MHRHRHLEDSRVTSIEDEFGLRLRAALQGPKMRSTEIEDAASETEDASKETSPTAVPGFKMRSTEIQDAVSEIVPGFKMSSTEIRETFKENNDSISKSPAISLPVCEDQGIDFPRKGPAPSEFKLEEICHNGTTELGNHLCGCISKELHGLMAVQTRMSEERLQRLEERFKSLEVQILRQFESTIPAASHQATIPPASHQAQSWRHSSTLQLDDLSHSSPTSSPKARSCVDDLKAVSSPSKKSDSDLISSTDDTSFKLKEVWTEKTRISNIVESHSPYPSFGHRPSLGSAASGVEWLTNETRLLKRRTEMKGKESMVEEKKKEQRATSKGICRFAIVHPSSTYRLMWDLNGMTLIAYDVITIPLFMAFPFGSSLFQTVMFWWTLLFWTADFVFAWFTGYYSGDVLEMRLLQIAKHYIRTWCILDIIVIGVDWFIIIVGGDSGGGGARLARASKSIRALRVLRSLRLLRLAKLERIMNDIKDRILVNSQFLVILIDIIKLIIIMLVVCHLIACLWYSVGSSGEETGWVNSEVQDGSFDRYRDKDISFLYITCLHWAMAQFTPAPHDIHPKTTGERTFTSIVVLFGMIIFSSFVSNITATMTRLRQLSSNDDTQLSHLRRYLRQHRVNSQLSIRIQRYCEFVLQDQKKRIQEQDVHVLKLLSEPLQQRLAHELYEPVLSSHPFFAKYSTLNESAFLVICKQCLSQVYFSNGDSVFASGTAAESMLIVAKGKLTYSWNPHGLASKRKQIQITEAMTKMTEAMIEEEENSPTTLKDEEVGAGQSICEAVLWMSWDHVGTLIAETVCELVSISSDKFAALTKQYATAHMLSQTYAQSFVEECGQLDEVTDLVSSDPEFMEKVVARSDMRFNSPF